MLLTQSSARCRGFHSQPRITSMVNALIPNVGFFFSSPLRAVKAFNSHAMAFLLIILAPRNAPYGVAFLVPSP